MTLNTALWVGGGLIALATAFALGLGLGYWLGAMSTLARGPVPPPPAATDDDEVGDLFGLVAPGDRP